ncbi:MAG: SAM-dependent methyltransferase, partial [Sphingomicrobium sp.]
ARAIWSALRPGARFAGELGGEGNLAQLRQTLDDVLVQRGFGPPTYAANWYPSVDDFVAVYEDAGFKDIDARLIERPTPLDHGVAPWVLTFRAGWLDRAGVPPDQRQAIADEVADRVGTTTADYVRLRFWMRKPAR